MTSAITLDPSKFPLVRITLPSRPNEEDTVEVYRQYDAYLAKGRHVLLVDLRALDPVFGGAIARKFTLREVEKRNAIFEKTLIAEARLVSGSVTRGIVTAFEWMRRKPRTFPLNVLDDENEALAWLDSRLAEEAMTRPR